MFKDQTQPRHITGSRAVISKTFTVHEGGVLTFPHCEDQLPVDPLAAVLRPSDWLIPGRTSQQCKLYHAGFT